MVTVASRGNYPVRACKLLRPQLYDYGGPLMPTLIYADGFHHKTADGSRFGGAADTGLWSAVNTGGGITFGNETYDSGPDIQIVEGGAALANVQRGLAAGIRTLVGSFYFK